MGRRSYAVDKKWEEQRLTQILESGFLQHPWTIIEDRKTQKKGIDVWEHHPSGDIGREFKVVRYPVRVGAITIETHSDLKSGDPDGIGNGWIDYSEAIYLDWCFTDMAYTWSMSGLRFWFYLQDVTRWPAIDTDNKTYTTRTRKVPFGDIPLQVWKKSLTLPSAIATN